jgi:spermidine synthase
MTSRIQQWDAPDVRLVETTEGEVTLSIEGQQAMQAWERDLMWAGADHLCTFGTEFLEVGLGLGISALRIASNPAIQRHVVIERYGRVIELFRERHPNPPPTLKIVEADVFEHYHTVLPASLDGVFFIRSCRRRSRRRRRFGTSSCRWWLSHCGRAARSFRSSRRSRY